VVVAGRISIVPTPYPEEFPREVVAVTRQGGHSRAQVARSFGISDSGLAHWLRIADRDDGGDPAPSSTADEVEVRELPKRNRTARAASRDHAARNGVLRPRHPPKIMSPLVLDLACAHGIPVAVTCRVLGFSKQAFDK
jgi:transposase-like protein